MARTKKGFAMSAEKLKTKLQNDLTFAQYYYNLKNIAQSTFLYEGLPDTINTDYMERVLFNTGMAVIFDEPFVGLVCLPAVQAGKLNIYGLPTKVRAYSGYTGFSRVLNYTPGLDSECVLIFNTGIDLSSELFRRTIAQYAQRLADIERTSDINLYANRTPVTIVLPEGQRETFINTIDRYENFGKMIVGYKGLDVDAIKSLKTDAPYLAGDLQELLTKKWNEAISFLGVSNVSIYKKERVTTDEVARSMGGAIANRNVRQNPREKAIKEINRLYGLSAKVTFNEDLFDIEESGLANLTGYNRNTAEGGN